MVPNSSVSGIGKTSHERGEFLRAPEIGRLPLEYLIRPQIVDRAVDIMGRVADVHPDTPVVNPYVPQPETASQFQMQGVTLNQAPKAPGAPEALFSVDSQHDQASGVVGTPLDPATPMSQGTDVNSYSTLSAEQIARQRIDAIFASRGE